MASNLNRPVDTIFLQLVEIPTSERNSLDIKTVSTPLPVTVSELQTNFLKSIEDTLAGLKFPAPASLLSYQITNSRDRNPLLQIYYLSDKEISADALDLMVGDVKSRLDLSNAVIAFERIPTGAQKIPFQNGKSELDFAAAGIWSELGGYLKQNPQLQLKVTLDKSEDENQNPKVERQDSIKKYFIENLEIPEKRLVFSESENESEADTLRIILPR